MLCHPLPLMLDSHFTRLCRYMKEGMTVGVLLWNGKVRQCGSSRLACLQLRGSVCGPHTWLRWCCTDQRGAAQQGGAAMDPQCMLCG